MKKAILLIAVILLSTAGLAQAQEAELHGVIDITYQSSYIWRGFDWYPEGHSAIQPSIDLDLYGTGFGINLLWSRSNASGFENKEWLITTLYYGNSLFEGEAYATDYKIGWVYYNYPDNPRAGNAAAGVADMQELFATLSWPEICPMGIVPSYTVVRLWPARSGSLIMGADGWIHIFGLGYDLTIPGILPETSEQVLHLSMAAVYNDGAGAPGVDHDWSHGVLGVSTSFDLGNNLTFIPALYYQSSWDDSVNDDDETWVSLSVQYKF